jgi:hypothetical protein
MLLEKTITIYPPAYSDNNGKIINPEPLTLDSLNTTYIDETFNKRYYARIEGFPTPVFLYDNKEYDNAGVLNKNIGEAKLKQLLGDTPEKFLRSLFPKTIEENPNGPGTILSQMIKSVGIVMTQGCSCKRHAIEMNEKGNDWCENNIDTIVGWLREEAKKRKLPFMDTLGKIIVNRAVKKSRKLLANEPVPENDEDLDKS